MKNCILCGAAMCASAAVAFLLVGCPLPMDLGTASRVTDKSAVVISISSPGNNAPYTQTVVVQGTQNKPGKIKTLIYTVTGTLGVLLTDSVPLGSIGTDGSFSFSFSTLTFSGPIAVTVAARDWNDNTGQAMITLTSPGSALSSFTVTPGNKKVTLNWEPIAGATYTVYYTTNGTMPSQTYGSQAQPIAPPFDIPSLKNGAMCVFLMRATSGTTDYWSGFTSAIPLSQFTLAPMVTAGYHQVSLEWNAIDGTNQFQVYRDSSPTGSFAQYSGVISGTSFTDTSVTDGTTYYYKVKPALAGATLSTFNGAQTFQLPPGSAQAMTSINTPSPAYKVRVYGTHAFVAAGSSGLLVIDISTPSAPAIVASVSTTNALGIDLDAAGTYALIADGNGGLRIISISNPNAPSIVATYDAWSGAGNITAVSVINGFAYVLSGGAAPLNKTLYGVNISTPSAPVSAGSYQSPTYSAFLDLASSVIGVTRTIFVTTGNGTNGDLLKITHTGTVTYTLIGSPYTNGTYSCNYISVNSVSAAYVYVLAGARAFLEPPPPYALLVVNAGTMALTGTSGTKNGWIADAYYRAVDNKVYAADGTGLQVIDVSAPAAPVLKDSWNTPGASLGAVSDGSYGYVVSGPLGFQTVDLSRPNPSVSGTYNQASMASSAVRGTIAYTTSATGLRLVNVSNPASPTLLGSLGVGSLNGIALSGTYAFVLAGTAGLKVVDCSVATAPALTGSVAPISGSLSRLAVRGDYAFVAAGTGLHVYDISDPAHPIGVGFADTDGGGIQDVALRGSRAYINDGAYFQPSSLKVLDISNPLVPSLLAKTTAGFQQISRVSLYGDYAFVTDNVNSGLYAVNINSGSGSYMTTYGPCDTLVGGSLGNSYGVAAFGPFAYVADSAGGFAVVDASAPASLANTSLMSNLALPGATDLVMCGKYAYTVCTAGLAIVKLF